MPMNRLNTYTIEFVDASDDTLVAHAPSTIVNTLRPPYGFVYEVIHMFIDIPDPAGSAAGTHRLSFSKDNGATDRPMAFIQGNTGSKVYTGESGFIGDTEQPPAPTDQFRLMRGGELIATYDSPINLVYLNSTDVDQAGTRTMEFWCKKYREAI